MTHIIWAITPFILIAPLILILRTSAWICSKRLLYTALVLSMIGVVFSPNSLCIGICSSFFASFLGAFIINSGLLCVILLAAYLRNKA